MAQFGPEAHRPLDEASAQKNMYYVYFLKSLKNNKIYVGFTSKQLKERLVEHNQGSNKFTRNNGPWKLLYYEQFYCKQCAKLREHFFKTGVGKKIKKAIVQELVKTERGAVG